MTETSPHQLAVCIGRFQIFHNGQRALLTHALSLAPRCAVIIGSAHQARSPRNPFTWQERAEMIRLGLPEADRERIDFIPMRDYYNAGRWVEAVRAAVATLTPPAGASIVLVGHRKDSTSEYLNEFPGWTLADVGRQGEIHAKSLRDAYFSAEPENVESALAAIVNQVPVSTVSFLRAWAKLPYFPTLALEWQALADDKAKWASAPYPPVFVTVDAIVKCAGQVLLIRRGRAPGKGMRALPGGFLEQRDTVYQSAVRELEEETALRLLPDDLAHALKEVKVFDHPDRSQRGRVITHAHFFDLGQRRPPQVQGSDDADEAQWVKVEDLAAMEDQFHDDHFHILDYFLGLTR